MRTVWMLASGWGVDNGRSLRNKVWFVETPLGGCNSAAPIITMEREGYVLREFNSAETPLNPVISGPFPTLEAAQAAAELIGSVV